MGVWGKIIGGVAGFAMGGPFGALMGAALGHAAESGRGGLGGHLSGLDAQSRLRVAALIGRPEEVYALCVVVLAARLAKCDGPVTRTEIDTFKQQFRVPPEAARDVGRLFDEARDGREPFEPYADELQSAFSDRPDIREDVLLRLFAVARADGGLRASELAFLQIVCGRLGLGQASWNLAMGTTAGWQQHMPPPPPPRERTPGPYEVLGVAEAAGAEEIRAAWLRLVRENHPDTLSSRGASADLIARAGDRVARINAAWDRIKRERGW